MLEEEIKNLTEAIKILTETLKQEKEAKPKTQKIERAVKDLTSTTPEIPRQITEIPKEIKELVNEVPTIEELQSLCTRIVRTNRDKKKDIVNLLENYNRAKTISQVPVESLEELKSKLLEL